MIFHGFPWFSMVFPWFSHDFPQPFTVSLISPSEAPLGGRPPQRAGDPRLWPPQLSRCRRALIGWEKIKDEIPEHIFVIEITSIYVIFKDIFEDIYNERWLL